VAYHYYNWIEKNKTSNLFHKLFVTEDIYKYLLDYEFTIIACYVGQHKNAIPSFHTLFKYANTLSVSLKENIVSNLQFYIKFIDSENLSFFYDYLAFVKNIYLETGSLKKHIVDITDKMKDKFTTILTHYDSCKILSLANSCSRENDATMKNGLNYDIILTITSCKRFDLFEKTINSFLNNCSDVNKITYFFCVDDNSSDEDREKMMKMYPFFDFYFKNSGEKGHRQSMNIIWNKLNELKPRFYLHLEDDWLFINKRSYVTDSISFLERVESDGIHQILFNKNYAEIVKDYNLVGGEIIDKDNNIKLHIKDEPNLHGSNCAYWPHFSFRPSVIRTSAVLTMGDFNSPNTFFERDYADKYFNSGYMSAYFNEVNSIHIGKLTSESRESKKNAYELNNEEQFSNSGNVNAVTEMYNKDNKIKVINLARRRDRRENAVKNFKNVNITNYEFIEAVDGKALIPTSQVITLFKGNDFGNRRGVIGCALTHYNLWKQLVESDVDYFLIMEDDFTIIKTFKTEIKKINFEKYDILLMGYHMFSKTLEKVKEVYRPENEDEDITIDKLQLNYYIGGIHCYSINKNGARKLLDYIDKNGIKHGIDYLFKIIPELECFETRPHISFAEWNEGGKAIDSDIQNIYEKLDFTTISNTVYVSGIGGLGNNLFQLAVAIYYKETNKDKNINIILDGSSELLRHGSGNKFGRKRLKTSYLDSILNKFNTSSCIPKCDYNLYNDCLSLNKIDLSNKENSSILISGYCQNVDLFFSVGEKLLEYFNLDDSDVKNSLLDKYKIDSSAINIMLGIRIGIDGGFKYSKFTKQTYTSVLNTIVSTYDDDKVINVYVLSDIEEYSCMIEASDKYNIIYVDEDDIGQIYVGLMCNYFILSDSTFHWWIAFLKWSKDNSTNVHVCNDTDITNRCLLNSNLRKEWKFFDIVPDSDFIFFKNVDCYGNDAFHKCASVPVLMDCAKRHENCIAFNTLGYFKHKIDMNKLVSSPYFKECDGIYIKREYYEANKDKDCDNKTDKDNGYIFIEGLDQKDCDLYRRNNMTIEEMKAVADKDPNCVCFNTLGFFKREMSISRLIKSPYFRDNDGLYVKKEHYKFRVKMLCNWCSSKDLCNEWSNMCESGYTWKNIEITWDDCNIDYWVIINKPCDNSYYDPKRTIVFQMEPWINNESHLWGVKTWDEWAQPDENKFLAVRGRKTKCHNNAFWQLELNLNELIDLKYENENKMDAVSSICSSKYYDEGHIARIDFLKFLETKGGIPLDIFNQDNQHNFKTYRGPLTPYVDKSKGIAPYKYYFMVENNYEENFITEKIWEPILCETLVFYYGCPNVCDYINPEAFVQLDMNDFEKSYQIIKQAIEEDWWSKRIEAIRREKKKILDELAFFPVIENIILKRKVGNSGQDKYDTLVDLIDNNRSDKNTTHSYLDLYEKLLYDKKYKAKNVLEIGIGPYTNSNGGSIKLWHDYFVNANIYALDVLHMDDVWDGIKFNDRINLITSTDAYNEDFFNSYFLYKNLKFDFLLDDGPHTIESMKQFIKLYTNIMTEDGILIIEDVQHMDWIQELTQVVPEHLQKYVEVYDLRYVKQRYDDIVFVINKKK
jgi:GR25 family glycosyltransferase involved in LPS biosynthesis